jgi:hypothetical protein
MHDYPSFDVEITLSDIEWQDERKDKTEELPGELTFNFRFNNTRFIYVDDRYLFEKFEPEINELVIEEYGDGAFIKKSKELVSYAQMID